MPTRRRGGGRRAVRAKVTTFSPAPVAHSKPGPRGINRQENEYIEIAAKDLTHRERGWPVPLARDRGGDLCRWSRREPAWARIARHGSGGPLNPCWVPPRPHSPSRMDRAQRQIRSIETGSAARTAQPVRNSDSRHQGKSYGLGRGNLKRVVAQTRRGAGFRRSRCRRLSTITATSAPAAQFRQLRCFIARPLGDLQAGSYTSTDRRPECASRRQPESLAANGKITSPTEMQGAGGAAMTVADCFCRADSDYLLSAGRRVLRRRGGDGERSLTQPRGKIRSACAQAFW